MRKILLAALAMALAGCEGGDRLSENRVRTLVTDRLAREGGITLSQLHLCRRSSDECEAAIACITPIVEDTLNDGSIGVLHEGFNQWNDVFAERDLGHGSFTPRNRQQRLHLRGDIEIPSYYEFPAFRVTRVEIVEVTDDVAEGLRPDQTARGDAKLRMSLVPTDYATSIQGCPGFAAVAREAMRRPLTFDVDLRGDQVNRGSGARIEWRITDIRSEAP